MTHGRTRADAAAQEDMTAHWRDWCAYLRAALELLEVRAVQADGRAVFEQDDAHDTREQRARETIESLPPARRLLFRAVHEARRIEYHGAEERAIQAAGSRRGIDPDQVDRQALTALLAEAEGRESEDGWGLVPDGTAEQITWYQIDVATLLDAPTEALYTLGRSSAASKQQALRMLVGIIGGAVLLLIIWATWPKSAARQMTEQAATIMVGGAAAATWEPVAVTLSTSVGVTTTLPLTRTASLNWPTPAQGGMGAWWRPAIAYPLTLCLPAALLADATTIAIHAPVGLPTRHYTLTEGHVADDLVVQACEGAPELHRSGMLTSLDSIPSLAIGEAGHLEGGITLRVQDMRIIGPGSDPTLPTGQAQVVVSAQVSMDGAIDWPTLAPSLLLESGEVLLPSSINTNQPDQPSFTYLIPAPADAMPIAWQVAAAAEIVRWRATPPPLPSRDAVVRAALEVRGILPSYQPDGSILLRVRLFNLSSATPLVVTPSDLRLLRGDTGIPIPAIPELSEPIAPQHQREFSLSVPADTAQRVLRLTVGTEQFQIAPTPE